MDEGLDFNGKKYISSKRLSQINGYAHDYISRLCREGKIDGKLVGRNWFVDPDSLLLYKKGSRDAQKDKIHQQQKLHEKNKKEDIKDDWDQTILFSAENKKNTQEYEKKELILKKEASYNKKDIILKDISSARNKTNYIHKKQRNVPNLSGLIFLFSVVVMVSFVFFVIYFRNHFKNTDFLFTIFESSIVIENR